MKPDELNLAELAARCDDPKCRATSHSFEAVDRSGVAVVLRRRHNDAAYVYVYRDRKKRPLFIVHGILAADRSVPTPAELQEREAQRGQVARAAVRELIEWAHLGEREDDVWAQLEHAPNKAFFLHLLTARAFALMTLEAEAVPAEKRREAEALLRQVDGLLAGYQAFAEASGDEEKTS